MTPDFTRIPYGFDEFPRATLAQWQQQAAGTVEPWQSPEGIAHRALYTEQDQHQLPHRGSLPGIPPFLRGAIMQPCRRARALQAMAFDTARGETLLFGGQNLNGLSPVTFTDTWGWNGSTWIQHLPATSPPALTPRSMACDEQRGRVVMAQTGQGYNSPSAIWEWDGSTWSSAGVVPTPRWLAYDRQRARIVGFDQADTWAYGVPGTAVATSYGHGCGAPPLALAPAPGSRPVTGQTQTLDVSNVPAALAFAVYGWSNAAAGPLTLPFEMSAFGMPGCDLLQSVDLTVPCTSTGAGTASHSIVIPNLAALVGLHLFAQAWSPAPGANVAGVVLSNGISLFVGSL